MDIQTVWQKLYEHMLHDEKVERTIMTELAAVQQQTTGLMNMRKFVMGAALTVGLAVFGSWGAFQYASGQQSIKVDQNTRAVKEIKKDVSKIKADTARIDERTKIMAEQQKQILEELRRR